MAGRHRHSNSGRRLSRSQTVALGLAVGALVLIPVLLLILTLGMGSSDGPTKTLPEHDFRPEDFRMVNGRMHYSGTSRQGIDISEHQQQIDWRAVAEDGISFAMVRLGYRGTTEGGLFRDEQAEAHMDGAQSMGIRLGAYFFSQATTVDEAIQEADLALEILDGRKLDLPVMFDWEIAYEGRTADVSYSTVTACTLAFCKRIEEGGYRAGTYFNLEMAKNMRMADLADYVLWLADYHDSPRFPYEFTFWQYTDKGHVSGIEGIVDLDLMFPEKPKPEPEPSETE